MLATNAIDLYGFDVDAEAARRVGALKSEIGIPVEYAAVPLEARKCPAFAPKHQREPEAVAV